MTDTTTRKKRLKFVPLLAAGAVGLIIGSMAGCGTGRAATVATPGPTITTERVEEVPVTPEECLIALDAADAGFQLASRMGEQMGAFITAVQNMDVAAIEVVNGEMAIINDELQGVAPLYTSNRDACRGQ